MIKLKTLNMRSSYNNLLPFRQWNTCLDSSSKWTFSI